MKKRPRQLARGFFEAEWIRSFGVGKFRPEALNDFRNLIGNLIEGVADTATHYPWAPICKCYERVDVLPYVHLRGRSQDYRAMFEYRSASVGDARLGVLLEVRRDRPPARNCYNDLDESMLIGVVDLFQKVEAVLATPASMFVRL